MKAEICIFILALFAFLPSESKYLLVKLEDGKVYTKTEDFKKGKSKSFRWLSGNPGGVASPSNSYSYGYGTGVGDLANIPHDTVSLELKVGCL